MDENNEYLKRVKQIHKFNTDAQMKELMDFYNTPSFWQILKIARNETSHSSFISYYLNPNNHHSLGTIFLRHFLEVIAIRALQQKADIDSNIIHLILSNPVIDASDVEAEKFMRGKTENGRFDIFIRCKVSSRDTDNKTSENSARMVIVVENKVCANETISQNDIAQTEKYKENICKEFPDYSRLFVLLSPDSNDSINQGLGVNVRCSDFIHVTYQDILSEVIEPILNKDLADNADKERLNDYIKCLSMPALEESTNNVKYKKKLIMAMGEKEKQLLMKFWNSNEELIRACLNAISANDEFDAETRKIAEEASSANYQRDTTKYFLGTDMSTKYSKSSLVPKFIQEWAACNNLDKEMPDKALEKLNQAFPPTIRGSKDSKEEIVYMQRPGKSYDAERNYREISVGKHTFYVATYIWTKERFNRFMDNAESLSKNNPELKITVAN